MTSTSDHEAANANAGRQRLTVLLAFLLTVPGLLMGLALLLHWPHPELSPPAEALLFGLAVVGAAFILSWAAEVAQIDISAGLAIAVLALIAVLPEYAVSFVFAWRGGTAARENPDGSCVINGDDPCSFTLANMTGGNRLLVGVGWAMVVLLAWWRLRSKGNRSNAIELPRSSAVEVAYLALATVYSLTLPLKNHISLLDMVVLVGIFVAYTVRISKAPAEEPHLIGPAAWVGSFPTRTRRSTVGLFFVYSAGVILLSAEHFAQGLVETGTSLGISSFFLVQWLAPLASEAPELLVAGLFAWRTWVTAGMTTLISSKVNQWTLLIGTLPLVFAVASRGFGGLPVDDHQTLELLLTGSQSLFAVSLLLRLRISVAGALALLGLFVAQFVLGAMFRSNAELLIVSIAYLALSAVLIIRHYRQIARIVVDGFRTPYSVLVADEGEPAGEEVSRGGH